MPAFMNPVQNGSWNELMAKAEMRARVKHQRIFVYGTRTKFGNWLWHMQPIGDYFQMMGTHPRESLNARRDKPQIYTYEVDGQRNSVILHEAP